MGHRRVLILGVTASGKGRLAADLAQWCDAELISVDSMKVYRRMDIGTAKPPLEVRRRLDYHLMDIREPSESFNVRQFLDEAKSATKGIEARGKPAIAVGGTAMYIKALLYGLFEGPGGDLEIRETLRRRQQREGSEPLHAELTEVDPEAASRIHPNDSKRIIRALEVYYLTGRPISTFQQQWTDQTPAQPSGEWFVVGLQRRRDVERRRINARVKRMLEEGLAEEVEALLHKKPPMSEQARSAIGYAEMIEHLEGRISLDRAVELVKRNSRRLAKQQRGWFRRFKGVHWLDIGADEDTQSIFERAKSLVARALDKP
jgi:tRNA dimethylallyltransferase